MLEGWCRCRAVSFEIKEPVHWGHYGLATPASRRVTSGSELLITSAGGWQMCIRCATGLFHQSGQVCSAQVPALRPEVEALHQASEAGDVEKVKELVQLGMAVDAKLNYQTALERSSNPKVWAVLEASEASRPTAHQPLAGTLEGRCLCGDVRFRLTPPGSDVPNPSVGTDVSLPRLWRYLSVPDEQFRITRGKRLLRNGNWGDKVESESCRRCDYHVSFRFPGNPSRTSVILTPRLAEQAKDLDWCEISPAPSLKDDALHQAARDGDLDLVTRLLDSGAPVDLALEDRTPLDFAASAGHLKVCRLLLDRGADVQQVGHPGQGSPELYRLLLGHGARPQKFLADAVHYGNVESVRVLLAAGADLNVPDEEEDWTMPLHWSAHNSSAMIRFVLKNGADVSRLSKGGGHALGFCAIWGKTTRMRTLLECGFPPNLLQADSPDSALYGACRHGFIPCVQVLLEYGADANLGLYERTPLMVAAAHGSLALVNLLLEHGADPALRDDNGQTALDYARSGLSKCAERGNSYLLGKNFAGEPAYYRKEARWRRYYEWTDCHSEIVDRLASFGE